MAFWPRELSKALFLVSLLTFTWQMSVKLSARTSRSPATSPTHHILPFKHYSQFFGKVFQPVHNQTIAKLEKLCVQSV